MFALVVPYLLTLMAVLIIAYCVGFVIVNTLLKHLSLQKFQSLFLHLFLGVVISTIAFSLIKSGFRSVNLILLPILGVLYYEARNIATLRIENKSTGTTWIPALLAGVAALLIFSLKAALVYKGGAFPLQVAGGADYAQHALISEALGSIGVENKFAPESLLSDQFRNLVPYHYFDLWFNAMVSSVGGLTHFLVLQLVTYPLFLVLGLCGFLALWESQTKVTWWAYVIAIVFLGFGSLHFEIYNNIAYLSKVNYRMVHFGETVWGISKLTYYLPFAFAFAGLLINRYYIPAFLVLAALSVIYFSAIILFALPVVFMVINLIKPIWVSKREAVKLGAYLAMPIILWLVFFKIFGGSVENTRDAFSLNLFDSSSIRTRINIFGLSTIQAGVMYFPLVMGLLMMAWGAGRKYYWNKQVLLVVLLAISVFFVGLSSWVLAYQNMDGMQLMGNNMPVLNALVLSLFVWFWQGVGSLRSKPAFYGGVLLIVLLTFTKDIGIVASSTQTNLESATYSDEFLVKVASEFTDASAPMVGIFLKGDEEYYHKQYWPAHRVSQSFRLIDPLVLMPQYSSTVHLSIFDMPISEEPLAKLREENSFKGQIFNLFVNNQKKNNNFKSIEQSQLDFVKQYDIKYIFATPSAKRPDWIREMKRSEISDKLSGISFITLEYESIN
ncbi:hypothetical protein BH09BAC1_BH09BAC1_00880 [soil metagenome]